MFKFWSDKDPKIKEQLKPNLWLRNWNDLNSDDKCKIWKFLEEEYFFNFDKQILWYNGKKEYSFSWKDWRQNFLKKIIEETVSSLNENFKFKSFGKRYLRDKTLNSACLDFYEIFNNGDANVVLELLSIYSKIFIDSAQYNVRCLSFDEFSSRLNDIFSHFWVNVVLTKQWFIPKQEEKVIEKIFKPTLEFLSDKKWDIVNRDLSESFRDYSKKDYSWCITKTISAIQWFLQIQVDWKPCNLSLTDWIKKSKEKWLIPDDIFTEKIFKNIDSIISRERQETWDAHPKRKYANEKSARLILNLSMVFMQHFTQITY